MEYGKKLPASNGKTGVVGFCWGGARSFGYAAAQPSLNAAVVFYGEAPGSRADDDESRRRRSRTSRRRCSASTRGNDTRINGTIPATQAAMKKLGKSYEVHNFEGAGHGFMGDQAGAGGANLKAALAAWPLALEFYRQHLR